MAGRYSKTYNFPAAPEEKKKKPKLKFAPDGTQMALAEDFGWGRKWQAAGGNAEQYSNTARKLLEAQSAEAEARIANPERALTAQKQEAELEEINKLAGLKQRQGEAGIKAMLGQLGMGEKPGGGMESIKDSNLHYQDQPSAPTFSQGQQMAAKKQQSFIGPPEMSGPPDIGQTLTANHSQAKDSISDTYSKILASFNGDTDKAISKLYGDPEDSQAYNALMEPVRIKKYGKPKTKNEQLVYDLMQKSAF